MPSRLRMQHSFYNFGKIIFKITLEKCVPMVHNLVVYGMEVG
jgi:hypothetical protein